jgi:predicted AlkP superfamily pyrophosphatase or phosphodiesterase
MNRSSFSALAALALLLVGLVGCGSDEANANAKPKHALVIGIDGLRPDALREASTPSMDSVIADGVVTYDAFAGGELSTATQQQTYSGPGWSSILTGVWTDKHGVVDNNIAVVRVDEYPHFFQRIRERRADVYLSSFAMSMINDNIVTPGDADEVFTPDEEPYEENDVARTAAAVAHLAAESPDVMFVYFGHVDHSGHLFGYGPTIPEYMDAVETVDDQIGQILDALRARVTFEEEDWLVMVATDHGGLGRTHGGQTPEERTIPLITSGGNSKRGQEISPGPGQTAVPPTVLRHLGIPVDPAWGWESPPFGF